MLWMLALGHIPGGQHSHVTSNHIRFPDLIDCLSFGWEPAPTQRGRLGGTSSVDPTALPAGPLPGGTFTSVLASSSCFSSSYRSLDSHRGCSMLSSTTGKSWKETQARPTVHHGGDRTHVGKQVAGSVSQWVTQEICFHPSGAFRAPGAQPARESMRSMAPGAPHACHLPTYFQGPCCLLLFTGSW